MSWTWRLADAVGAAVEPGADTGVERAEFASQSDAESWVGERWRDLLAAGVEQVSLFEDDRKVYGPMSLRPPE